MAGFFSQPNLASSLEYDDTLLQSLANTSDFLQGLEQGQNYFLHTDTDLAVCCECECHCDIFTDRFLTRFGATNPNSIEYDRANDRVWEASGVTLGTGICNQQPLGTPASHACAIFAAGGGSLKCLTPPLDSNNFCVTIHFQFMSFALGQKIRITYGNLVAELEMTSTVNGAPPFSYPDKFIGDLTISYPGMLTGTLTGTSKKVKATAQGGPGGANYLGALMVKDGVASLLLGFGEKFGDLYAGAPTRYTVVVPGITQQAPGGGGQDFVTVETESLANEVKLFGFHLSNIQNSEHHNECQERIFGTERTCSDDYSSDTYQLDFHYVLYGKNTSSDTNPPFVLGNLDFQLMANQGVASMNGFQWQTWSSRGTPDSCFRGVITRQPPNTPPYEFTTMQAVLSFLGLGSNPSIGWPPGSALYSHVLTLTHFFTPGYAVSGTPPYTFQENLVDTFTEADPAFPTRQYVARRYKLTNSVAHGYSGLGGFFDFSPFFPLGDFTAYAPSGKFAMGILAEGNSITSDYTYCDITSL